METIAIAVVLLWCGCAPAPTSTAPSAPIPEPVAPAKPPAPLTELPVTLSVSQRSTSAIPGSNDQLSLTIDDITRGQVIVSIANVDGGPVLGPTSLEAGASHPFRVGEFAYRVTLEKLDNQLVGDDTATFVLTEEIPDSAPPPALSEAEKIDRLIAAVAALDGAVFIRNGSEHTPAEAAKHLRDKASNADDKVTTAQEFIDHIGSKSSLSGEEYTIRFQDGRTGTAREFLADQLAALSGAGGAGTEGATAPQ
jgi:hypothetical protein